MSEVEVEEVTKKNKSKPVGGPDALNPVGIRLPESLRVSLEAEADDRGITLGELCRQLIEAGHQDDPDRERKKLLRSLAITKEQLNAPSKDEDRLSRSERRRFARVIEAIEELEEQLNPTPRKSWLHREA
jgi:hypothetical protein